MDECPSKEQYNHAVIARHDPALSQLIFTSSVCDVFIWDDSINDWRGTETKGTLFLYSRIAADEYPYTLLVLNRQNIQDWSLGITPAVMALRKGETPIGVKLQENFLMLQAENRVYGLWLYESADRQVALQLIDWCITKGSVR